MNLTISSFYYNFSNMHPNMIKFCYRVYYRKIILIIVVSPKWNKEYTPLNLLWNKE